MPISASVRSRGARTGTAVAAALAVAGFSLAGAPAAVAAPGDSGDLSVQPADHSRGKHHAEDGILKVCEFKLVAKNFEILPVVPWTIIEQPPAVPPNTLTGSLPLVQGAADSQAYQLPDGTYLLTYIVPAGPKTKTFEVDCSEEEKKEEEKRSGNKQDDSSWSENEKSGGEGEKEYTKPSGAVPAGGGGVPTMEGVSSESDSNVGTTTALAAGAAGLAGLILVRRAARRRVRGEV